MWVRRRWRCFEAMTAAIIGGAQAADDLYAVLELNGVMRSADGAESWQDCSADLIRFSE
jgi:hypothetical protein